MGTRCRLQRDAGRGGAERARFNATKKALGEIARRHYPGISNWGPEQLRRLADRIDRAALNYSQDLNELQFISDEEELG